MRTHSNYATLLAALAVAACTLDVQNPNSPETKRVLSSALDVEALTGAQYKRWHEGLYAGLGNVWGMAAVQSFENYSALANNCMNQRNPIPRPANDNSIGNGCGGEQRRVYDVENEVQRTSSNVLARIQAAGFDLGTIARNKRAEAFAEFTRGLALGYLALLYDSSAVITTSTSGEDPGALRGYSEVMDSAFAGLDRAIVATNASTGASGAGGFPVPPEWIPTTATLSGTEFIKLIRSYKARFRANLARNPTDRAAVNWALVIADAQNGITADHDNITNQTTGPFKTWVAFFQSFATWHQMTPFVIGMADTSGAYAAWVAQTVDQRGANGFTMATPDRRFPQGTTRTAQQADFAITSCSGASATCKRYFVNRPNGSDQFQGPSWGWSNYDFVRFYPWSISGNGGGAQNGPIVFFTRAENDLLEAEGQIRAGNFSRAAQLIDRTRVANGGLPAVTGTVPDNATPVPGGNACVPKVPAGPSFNTLACGNLMEALKYEKRVETLQTHFAAWLLDMRGWGDLPDGTPVHWAPPYQDLQSRGRTGAQIYSTGGSGLGNPGTAVRGTYGW